MVEPVDPLQGGELDSLQGAPWPAAPDHLGHVETVDRLGQRVIVGIANAAHRGLDPGFGETLGVANRDVCLPGYRDLLQAAGMRQSMSRKGCCYDNAPMESFFHTLKVELVHRTRFETRDQARREVFAYVETDYNRQRAHSAIGYITPEQAEPRFA